MNISRRRYQFATVPVALAVLLLLILINTCKQFEALPLLLVHSDPVTGEVLSSCNVSATIVHLGDGDITQHGFCWSESANPDILTGSVKELGTRSAVGIFSSRIESLEFSKNYHLRAFATDNQGTTYSEDVTFTTGLPLVPTLATSGVSSVTDSSAVSGGNITT